MHSVTFSMEIGDKIVPFNIFDSMKHPMEEHFVFYLNVIDDLVEEVHSPT